MRDTEQLDHREKYLTVFASYIMLGNALASWRLDASDRALCDICRGRPVVR